MVDIDYDQKWGEALTEAQETAKYLGYRKVTPGCILIGLLRTEDTLAELVLRNEWVTFENALKIVPKIDRVSGSRNSSYGDDIPYDNSAVNIVDLAKQSGVEMEHGYRGPEHLVCGLGMSEEPEVVKMLGLLGTNGSRLNDGVRNLLGFPRTVA